MGANVEAVIAVERGYYCRVRKGTREQLDFEMSIVLFIFDVMSREENRSYYDFVW